MGSTGAIILGSFAFFVLAVVVYVRGRSYLSDRRGRAMRQWAEQHGWSYVDSDQSWVDRFPHAPFDRGSQRQVEHLITARVGGQTVRVFDYSFVEMSKGNDSSPGTIRYTVAVAELSRALPTPLYVSRERLLDKVEQVLGERDVQLDNAEFDRAFDVRCAEPRLAGEVLQPRLMEWLLGVDRPPPWRIDGAGLLWCAKGRVRPAEVDRCVEFVAGLAAALPAHLRRA